MAFRSLVGLVLSTAALAAASNDMVTPIAKVTELLKGLQAKVTEEGKKDAAAYDKYACFCKEQATDKQYAIEKSTKKINALKAMIEAGTADIANLDGKVSELTVKIGGENDELSADQKKDGKAHAVYMTKAEDLRQGIASINAAIKELEGSKAALKDAKLTFLQMEKPGEPAKYQYQSQHILDDLYAKYRNMKDELDKDEMRRHSMFQKAELGLMNAIKFDKKDKGEMSSLSADKTGDVTSAKQSMDEEIKDRAADQTFLDKLTEECEEKAKLFDQRSQTRSNELSAMTQAIDIIAKGVTPNEGANKKLVGLVQHPSFLQIDTLQQKGIQATHRVLDLLQAAAQRLDSKVLQGVAVRAQLAGDNLVKVRGLIKDMLARLAEEAKSESSRKGFCDKGIKEAVEDRDTAVAGQEAANAKLMTLTYEKENLNEDIAELGEKVAQLRKALNDATTLRDEEKADNLETIASADQGKKAVESALELLTKFYNSALLQSGSKRSLQPTDGTYHGAQEESKGIMGMLEVIASDFGRTLEKVKDDESEAQSTFENYEKDTADEVKEKVATSDAKRAKLSATSDSIVEQEGTLRDANTLSQSSAEKLEALKADCVDQQENYAERKKQREEEIKSLQDVEEIFASFKFAKA